jgi:serine/threonine-protein kinase HipA
MSLRIWLDDTDVGVLARSGHEDRIEFRFLDSYLDLYPRPVLGQWFEDDLRRDYVSRQRLPPFFSNLLPEGELRNLIASEVGVAPSREYFLLRHLGEDLPGAIRAVPSEDEEDAIGSGEDEETEDHRTPENGTRLRFSLAGVQLKFSVSRRGKALVLPASGRGGDWLVKLPDARFERVPFNEWSTLHWAREAGISVPRFELVDTNQIEGLPSGLDKLCGEPALALERYDRQPGGVRIHQEDFAQILNLYPESKYRKFNYETIASIVLSIAGEEEVLSLIERIVFVIASGNGDAHHKNWSLIYPDSITPTLSPAYDQVSTIQYIADDQLALNLGGSKAWKNVDRRVFRRLGRKIGLDEEVAEERARAAVARIRNAWSDSIGDLLWNEAERKHIERHWADIPLMSDR